MLLAACAPGELKEGLAPNDVEVVAVAVVPAKSAILTGESVTIRASALGANGQPAPAEVNWTASGGTVVALDDSTAQFSASAAGAYRIRGRYKKNPNPADSTTITVSTPAPVLQAVILTPASVTLAAGAQQTFTVSGQWSDGSTTAPAVTYSATGGTVNTSGRYTAGTTAGSYRVIATQQGGSLADTSTVTITVAPPPTGGNPHEPTGMTIGFDESFTVSPVGQPSSGWFVELGGSNVSIVNDATAPVSGPKVLQLKFPAGFGGGVEPMVINWNETGHFPPNTGTLYLRMRVKLDPNWSDNGNDGTKFIWPRPTVENTAHFSSISRALGGMTVGFNFQASYLGGADDDNEDPTPRSLGVWHDVEWLLYQGSTAAANDGTVQVWVDGVLVVNETGKKFAKNGDALGWKYMSIAPVFGYGTRPVPHDQYIWIDHWYASVK